MRRHAIILAVAVAALGVHEIVAKYVAKRRYAASRQPVTGAFGFKLGERPPDFSEVKTNKHGELEISRNDATNTPPFSDVTATLTSDGRIYWISSMCIVHEGDFFTQEQAVWGVLTEKYRLKSQDCRGDKWEYVFGDEKREVRFEADLKLQYMSVIYTDETLATSEWDARRRQEETKARKAASGL